MLGRAGTAASKGMNLFKTKQERRAGSLRWGAFVVLVGSVTFSSGSLFAQTTDYVLDFLSGSGPAGGSAVVTTRVTIDLGATPLQGFSYGVCHDFTEVQPVAATLAPDLQVVNLGAPVDFSQVSFAWGSAALSGGVAHGVVVCLLQCATLPSGATTECLEVEYELLGANGTTSTLQYCDNEMTPVQPEIPGQPPLDLLVIVNGQAIIPVLNSGTIQITGGGFIRGDTDGSGVLQVGDGIMLLGHLFQGQPEPPCRDAADSNDDGILDITDATYSFIFLFCCGAPPPSPWPSCGDDPTVDPLDCVTFPAC